MSLYNAGARKVAIMKGEVFYFTGKPCKWGHVVKRRTSNGICSTCELIKSRARKEYNREYRDKNYGNVRMKDNQDRYWLSDKGLRTIARGRLARNLRRSDGTYTQRLSDSLRGRVYKAVRNKAKRGSAVRDLGCTVPEAMLYWQSLSTWNSEWTWADMGKKFHMDHIKPLALFDLTDREQFLTAVHYTNIQPLSIGAHRDKTKEDFKLIRESKNVGI